MTERSLETELRLLPAHLGLGVYISDSDDSCNSAVARWAHLEDESEDTATTVYTSARESSFSSADSRDSDESDASLFDDDDAEDLARDVPFEQPKGSLSSRAQGRRLVLGFEAKVAALEARRCKKAMQIEQEHITRATFAILRHRPVVGTKSETETETTPSEVEPSVQGLVIAKETEEMTDPPREDEATGLEPGEIEQETTEERHETQSDVAAPAAGLDAVEDETNRTGPREGPPEQNPAATEEMPTQAPSPHSHPTQDQAQAPVPEKTAALGPEPVSGSIPQAGVSAELLRMSEQMNIPSSFPPPASLFSHDAGGGAAVPAEEQIALHAAKTAIEFEEYHRDIAQQMVNSMGDYATNVATRSMCKVIDKNMKLHVNQISAQIVQIEAKVASIMGTLRCVEGSAGLVYAYAQLSRYIIHKCADIADSLVFAVAKTTVMILDKHPNLLSMLLSFLHEVSVLTVPKYYSAEAVHDTLLEKLGFRDIPGLVQQKETEDEFIRRQSGYVKFYAAIIELDPPMHGLEYGWTYLSRMLNNLPPSRITASALMSFLSVAGHALYTRYKTQFHKVLLYVYTKYLVQLGASRDDEARAVYKRLQTYLETSQFSKPPSAKRMPYSARSTLVHS